MMQYWVNEKVVTKKEFGRQRKKMLDEVGYEAVAKFTDMKTGKVLGKNLCRNFFTKKGAKKK